MKKKKKMKKQLNKKKLLILLLIISLFVFLSFKKNTTHTLVDFGNSHSSLNSSDYSIIKEDTNSNYAGIGQKKVSNKDGYFTTFTSADKKCYKEYKQNGSSSWSNHSYWGGTMSENGCGITSLCILLSGYGKDYTPESLRKKYYPVLDGEQIAKELSSTFGIKNSNFFYDDVHLSKNAILKQLKSNKPILVCVWNKPSNNRWTTASHYMVLLACDDKEKVYVSNPNGLENNSKSSGWYDINEITPFLAKVLFIES